MQLQLCSCWAELTPAPHVTMTALTVHRAGRWSPGKGL